MIPAPLNEKFENGEPTQLILGNQELQAVDELKTHLMNPPVLAMPRINREYTGDTDASDIQIGWVLLQVQDNGVLKTFGYRSHSLCNAEHLYDLMRKEFLADVVFPYVEFVPKGLNFKARSNHKALK